MIKLRDKKGAEFTVGTLIFIVLGIVVLVVLVLGFTGGWGNLWNRITNIFGGGDNLESIIIGCKTAATTENKYGFCCQPRELRMGGKKEKITCRDPKIGEVENAPTCSATDCDAAYKAVCKAKCPATLVPNTNTKETKKFCCEEKITEQIKCSAYDSECKYDNTNKLADTGTSLDCITVTC